MKILGLRTVIYRVTDLEKAKNWYTKLLGQAPYFDEPFYVGFNVGGFELGLDPSAENLNLGNNLHTYWGVENILDAVKHALAMGAKINSDVQEVGGGIQVATVSDPFGNIFGMIENPNFKIGS